MPVFENLQELVDLLGDAPDVAELTFSRPGGAQITIKRSPMQPRADSFAGQPSAAAPASSRPSSSLTDAAAAVSGLTPGETQMQPSQAVVKDSEVLADRVGIYHPARPPLGIGDQVAPEQIVGYIEAIKLMNEVRAGAAGTISEQFAEDGLPVEYGQPLFRIRAD